MHLSNDDRGDLARVLTTAPSSPTTGPVEYAFDGLHRIRRITSYPNWPSREGADVVEYAYDEDGIPSAYKGTL